MHSIKKIKSGKVIYGLGIEQDAPVDEVVREGVTLDKIWVMGGRAGGKVDQTQAATGAMALWGEGTWPAQRGGQMVRVAEAQCVTAAGVGVSVADRSQAIPELGGQARRLTFDLCVMGKLRLSRGDVTSSLWEMVPPVACGLRPGEVGGQGQKQGDAWRSTGETVVVSSRIMGRERGEI